MKRVCLPEEEARHLLTRWEVFACYQKAEAEYTLKAIREIKERMKIQTKEKEADQNREQKQNRE